MQRIPMTTQGAKQLEEELDHLRRVERRDIIEAIKEARAHGDLKENAEYHAAKERQSFIEGRIADIEGKLSHAQVIDITNIPNEGKVIFSSLLEGYGNTIIIQHKNNYATVYANNKKNLVKKGKWVKRGQNVAEVGLSSGKSNVPYLHFQIRKWNRPRNPLFYLPKS